MINTWNIDKMVCKSSEGSLTNVVESIYWECKKSDGVNEVSEKGVCTLSQPDPNSFTPYNQLTKAQVVSWVQTTLGSSRLTELADRLSAKLTEKTTKVSLDPPFTN